MFILYNFYLDQRIKVERGISVPEAIKTFTITKADRGTIRVLAPPSELNHFKNKIE
jgi:hypothetical protein